MTISNPPLRRNKPFLKWAGNKTRLMGHIKPLLPPAPRLIEPFTGSGAVFLNTEYNDYLLGESNADLVALYACIQKEGQQFIDDCAAYFKPQYNTAEQFYLIRRQFNGSTCPRERAILFIYLNRHGYNGLCRYNSTGGFNVPYGSYARPYFPQHELLNFHHKSQSVNFILADFRETFLQARAGDIIYCDPPYAPLPAVSNFSSYTQGKFGPAELLELARLANESVKEGITVIISNHDTALTREYYANAQILSFPVQRSISCDIENRKPVLEILALFPAQS